MDDLPVYIESIGYVVSCLPENDVERYSLAIRVERTAPDRWALRWRGQCLNVTTREWEYEHIPSERSEAWLADHRVTELGAAQNIACELAPTLRVGPYDVAGFLQWRESRRGT
jgi:hypothetical protein